AEVNARGVVFARKNGTARIRIEVRNQKAETTVVVRNADQARELHFEHDVLPILNRFACNSSGCHANSGGQNGFHLSVFSFDPQGDHNALTKENRGRRVFMAAPERSLMLAKPSGDLSHGGGRRIEKDTPEYRMLRDWIAAGAAYGSPNRALIRDIRVEPSERTMVAATKQQLRVIARYADGAEKDVTHLAKFQPSQEGQGQVTPHGLATSASMPGEAAIMAQFMGHVAVFRAVVPRAEPIANYPAFPENNFIDGHIVRRLKKLNLAPSELSEDAQFLRRVHLDILGVLPTPAEVRSFLKDANPKKREAVIDRLLKRPEFADRWALIWADVLRVDRQALGSKRAYAMHRWIRDSIALDVPFDRFVRELLTAEGPIDEVAPAGFFKAVNKPGEMASSLTQVFLGLRIACAECHHHPFDRWSQEDYFGMQAFFTQVAARPTPRGEAVEAQGDPQTKHPRSGETILPHGLGAALLEKTAADRRGHLAVWMTAPENPWFARNLANRVWAHFMGRGIIDPVDDVRDTNPPSNPELLDALGKHVSETKFDLKSLIRTIANSRTYQLSSEPNGTNEKDTVSHSHAALRRIHAEVFLDAVSQATGVSEKFAGMPPGTRAVQLWDSKVSHDFLKMFGRPQRTSPCECERVHEPTVAQVLHLLNATSLQDKLSHDRGAAARLVRETKDDGLLAEELYLAMFSRLPTAEERSHAVRHLGRVGVDRRKAAEDLAWSMLNSLEFLFNH
ncbi:MAG: DUF1549 and DUF1553 domain-containing protein, partial [Gemmataceae bacterium]|nr:DUF1549 and DUF1553 domain-containing protein [Gemmataceae bacterium]